MKAGEDPTALLSELLTHQNGDGGFGDVAGYESAVLDTTFALEALAAQGGAQMSAAGYAVSYLLAEQHADGSWADNHNAPSIYLTALSLRALWRYRHIFALNDALDHAQAFLLAQRVGNVWPETFETALALIAVLPRLSDASVVADSIATLESAQLGSGSWEGDVYTTALALRALHLAQAGTPNPDLGAVVGHVIDGGTGFPLSGVTVQLSGSLSRSLVTGTDGRFAFSGLPTGPYGVSLHLATYAPLSAMTTLPIGGVINLGDLRLLKEVGNPATSTMQGLATEATTGAPLAGVTVTANGQTATTGRDGRYQMSHVVPGTIAFSATLEGYLSVSGEADLSPGAILVFSPALTPGTVPVPAALLGTITDAQTGDPLAGVTIEVTGDTVATATTDAQGAYRIEPLNVGPVAVQARLSGYDPVLADTNVSEFQQITFSPALYPLATTPPGSNASALTGVVFDASTHVPLPGVTVEASHGSQTESLTTDADGRFTLQGMTASEVSLRFTLEGYLTSAFALPIDPLSDFDMGQVRLRPEGVVAFLPDLTVTDVNVQATSTDPLTLALSGTVHLSVQNTGTSEAAAGASVTAFYDANLNGLLDSNAERVLGQTELTEALPVDAQRDVTLEVAGSLPFRDAPIAIWVDSGERLVELDEGNNVTTSARFCLAEPVLSGSFDPVLEWKWTGSHIFPDANEVLSTPVVMDLTGEGVPEVIFVSHVRRLSRDAHLRAIDGRDGSERFTVLEPEYELSSYGELAVGDIDLDGQPEIVAVYESNHHLIAFEHDGTFKWRSPMLPYSVGTGGASLADLNRDGVPEIIIGSVVLDNQGQFLWQGTQGRGAHPNTQFNAFGPLSVVANLDLEGDPEVVAGNTAYRSDGSVYWHNAQVPDGFNALGNFDATDDTPEIVLVANRQIYMLDHDGTLIWGPIAMPGGGRGGPPMVADVDGDGEPEFGVSGILAYGLFEGDGSLKWTYPIHDTSSGLNSSSAFDFDGDGSVEVTHSMSALSASGGAVTARCCGNRPMPARPTTNCRSWPMSTVTAKPNCSRSVPPGSQPVRRASSSSAMRKTAGWAPVPCGTSTPTTSTTLKTMARFPPRWRHLGSSTAPTGSINSPTVRRRISPSQTLRRSTTAPVNP